MKKLTLTLIIFSLIFMVDFVAPPGVAETNVKKEVAKVVTPPPVPDQKTFILTHEMRFFIEFAKYRNRKLSDPYIQEVVYYAVKIARENNFDPITIISIIDAESAYNKNVRGPSLEYGLMQIHPDWIFDQNNENNLIKQGYIQVETTKKGIIKKDSVKAELLTIEKNIKAGVYILSTKRESCKNSYDNKRLAALGYKNINECTIRRYNGDRSKDKEYYRRITAVVGDYYFFLRLSKG